MQPPYTSMNSEQIGKLILCIIDVKYTVYPSSYFVAEQKAADKRKSDQHMEVLEAGITTLLTVKK